MVHMNRRGITLVELLAAATVFGIVGLAMGAYYVFSVQRVEGGIAQAELQRNGSLVLQALEGAIRSAGLVVIPAEGEPPGGGSSITVRFPPEPFDDENLNGRWDSDGASGLCAPMECFQDLNGNGSWDAEVRPSRSFRLSGGGLQEREGDGPWAPYLEDRYPEAESSSVWVDELEFSLDPRDNRVVLVRLVLRDDRRTPEAGGDDLRQAFDLRVRRKG